MIFKNSSTTAAQFAIHGGAEKKNWQLLAEEKVKNERVSRRRLKRHLHSRHFSKIIDPYRLQLIGGGVVSLLNVLRSSWRGRGSIFSQSNQTF